jgi:hypothetical protein
MLDGLTDWLAERFRPHRGNADIVRQDLSADGEPAHSRAGCAHLRRELRAEARRRCVGTPPGHQLQIDFGETRFTER